MSVPFHTMRPLVGGTRPITERIVVVLPTPLRPNRHTHSPAAMSSDMPNNTRLKP
jgi:hypothetical protein